MDKKAIPANQIKSIILENLQFVAIILIPLLIGLFKPNYLTLNNLNNVLDLTSILIISAVGFSFVIESGSIDLSIEANMALAGVVMAKMLQKNPDIGFLAVLAAVFVSAFIGFLNGIIQTRLKIPSFLTTLGMAYIASGITTVITQGQYINFPYNILREIAIGRIGGQSGIIPNTLVIAIMVAMIIGFLSEKKRHGRHVLAIGGDESIARDLGVKVNRVKVLSYIIAGAAFGLAGSLLALKLGAGDSFSAAGYTFETISACVIGGISISGGVGKTYKAIFGAMIITIIRVAMVFFVIPSEVQAGFLGFVIILTVASTLDRSKLSVIR